MKMGQKEKESNGFYTMQVTTLGDHSTVSKTLSLYTCPLVPFVVIRPAAGLTLVRLYFEEPSG
jgi:hypothetical protein